MTGETFGEEYRSSSFVRLNIGGRKALASLGQRKGVIDQNYVLI